MSAMTPPSALTTATIHLDLTIALAVLDTVLMEEIVLVSVLKRMHCSLFILVI